MTAFDRLEPRIPELMDEFAPTNLPDYFDDMLRQTARTRQRPSWSSLERWIPMGVIARTAGVRQVPWRPIVVAALLITLATAAVALYAGSRAHRLPAPFGPARNGVIVTSINGDIVTVDPVTGTKTVIVAGPEMDTNPMFSSLGTQILFTRGASGSEALFMADADGSNVRQLVSGKTPILNGWLDWTADGRRLIYTTCCEVDSTGNVVHSGPKTWILDTVTGTTTAGVSGMNPKNVKWRPSHDEYVFASDESGRRGFFLAPADGSAARAIAFPDGGASEAQLSPDGSKLAYVQGESVPGPLHTIDIDTGQDRLLTQPGDGYAWFNPQFSPDGTQILAERSLATATATGVLGKYNLVLLPVDGGGPVIELGPAYDSNSPDSNALMQFSPDGTSVLGEFLVGDGTSWMLDTTGGPARQFDWPYLGESAWQRLAP
jgi:Tol biopolymer transport system component